MGKNLVLAGALFGLASCDDGRSPVWDPDFIDGGVVESVTGDVFEMRFEGGEEAEVSTTCGDIRRGIPFVYDHDACQGREPDEGTDCLEGERFCVPNGMIVPFPSFEGGYGEGREANIRAISGLVRCSFAGLDPWVVFSDEIDGIDGARVNQLFFGGFGAPSLPGYNGAVQDPGNMDHAARILVPEWMPVDDLLSFRQLPCQTGHFATRAVAQALGVDFGPEGSDSFRWPGEQTCPEREAWDFSPDEARTLVENTAGADLTPEQRAAAIDSLTSISQRCRAGIERAARF